MSTTAGEGAEYTFFAYMGIASALVFASKYYTDLLSNITAIRLSLQNTGE